MSQQGRLEDVGSLETLTGDTGGPVFGDGSDNINIIGGDTITVSGNPGTNTLTIDASASSFPITPFVVGPSGQAGYSTIQDAIDAATLAGGTNVIWVQPDTYTENLNITSSITFMSIDGVATITGSHTPPTSGVVAFDGFIFISSLSVLDSSASGSTDLSMHNSFFIITNGYIFDIPNWASEIFIRNCTENSINNGIINNVNGASNVTLISSSLGSGSGQTLQIDPSGRNIIFDSSSVDCPVNLSGNGNILFQNGLKFTNNVTIGGSLTGFAIDTNFRGGALQALTFNSSGNFSISNGEIQSTNNPSIGGTGSGTLTLTSIAFPNDDNLAGTLTVAGGNQYSATYKSDYTDHGVILGQGSLENMVSTAAGTDGQLLIGGTSVDPAFADLTSIGGTINITAGSNTLNIDMGGMVSTSVSVDSGGPAIPVGGNLDLIGQTSTDFTNPSGIETHVGATTDQVYFENKRWLSEFIVDPSSTVGLRGEFTTVQAAINAANSAGGGVVYIREGVYSENIILAADVSLIGVQANVGNKVQILGTITAEYTGRVDIENIFFETTGASLFVSTSGTPQLNMTNCFFSSTTGPVCLSSNASFSIAIDFCSFDPAFADIFSMSAGSLTVRYSNVDAPVGLRTRILASGTATYDFRFNVIDHFFETQGTASISIFNSDISSTTTSSFNINSAGSTISSLNNNVNSTAASGDFAIGTGTFVYGENVLPGTAKDIIGTLTQTIADSRPRSTAAATAATVEFGTCGFDSDQFTVTDGFVQSTGEIATTYDADTGSAVPAAGILTVSGGVGIDTSGSGSTLTFDSTFGGIDVLEVTVVGPLTMSEDTAFIANNAAQVDLVLPLTATLGSIVKVNGKGVGGWIISQNAGQTIHFLAQDTTTGAGGSLASTTQYDCITLRCITADTDFVVESVTGNLTVV